jgi:hypothetical protein
MKSKFPVEARCKIEGIPIRVVRHETNEAMRKEILDWYSQEINTFNSKDKLEDVAAMTVGQYVDHHPELVVFLGDGDPKNIDELIGHESVHAALGVIRQRQMNTFDQQVPVHINAKSSKDHHGVIEEDLCVLVGHFVQLFKKMAKAISDHLKGEQ